MSLKNKKVLITCGPTGVPIDAMRVISNRSTGSLGQTVASDFKKAGAKVTLLEGPVDRPLRSRSIRVIKFSYFDDFAALMNKELKKNYDICIHAAAVSDYKIDKPKKTKISSGMKTLKLKLVLTPKIIQRIKRIDPDILLVGFKYEPNISINSAKKKTRDLFTKSRCDLVVANSLRGQKYSGYIIDNRKDILARAATRKRMSNELIKKVKLKLGKAKS